MKLCHSVLFGRHDLAKNKIIELRRQDGGVVLVTGQSSSVYAVLIKTAQLYYLLNIFLRP